MVILILIFTSIISGDWEPQGETWHSVSFGGSVIVTEVEWSNWSVYWKIGQTSIYDVTLDMTVGLTDLTNISTNYKETGANGWINADVNDDGKISLSDLTMVATHYGEDYT